MQGGGRLLARVHASPRAGLAIKAALAAAVAWFALTPFGLDKTYAYYAPFGAVVAVTTTLARSVRGTTQVVVALVAAVLIALAVRLLALPTVLSVAAVVAVGVVVGGSRWLGENGSWVPISALLVLIVGGSDPASYVAGYLGLTTVGAAIGVLVNGVFPPLPLAATSAQVGRMRACLAEQLDELVIGLTEPAPPTADQWRERRRRLGPPVEQMRRSVLETAEARHGNWRARRWRETADRQYQHARTLERLSGLVGELVDLVVEQENADTSELALGPDLRLSTAGALEALAAVLRAGPGRSEDACELLGQRIRDLRAATRREWREGDRDRFTAAAVVTGLERATESLHAASA